MSEKDTVFIKALELAENLTESVSPRPPVGSIITHNGKIVGSGVTTNNPLRHAEINALNIAKEKIQSFTESTFSSNFSTFSSVFIIESRII